jgi:hypothetical protein
MVKKNKTIDLCPGKAGCGGRGVLSLTRTFGLSTATQSTFDKMKQIQPDLSRATANAMLGLSVHPYRKIPNDKLVPKHTATDKFFNTLNNQVAGSRHFATSDQQNSVEEQQDTNTQQQIAPQLPAQQIAPSPTVSTSSDSEITLTIPPSPTLSKSSSSGSSHSPYLSPESSPDSSPKLPPYNMKANTAAGTFTNYSGAGSGSGSGSSTASTFFPDKSSPSTSPNASALFNIGSPTGKMVSKEVDKIQNKPKSSQDGASGLITQQPLSPATSIGQTKPKKKKKPMSESKEIDGYIKDHKKEKSEDLKKQKLIAQQNKGKGNQGKAKQF